MKIKVDKSAPGEVAACDDCRYFKEIRTMQGETQNFCMNDERKGNYAQPALYMKYKASECDFWGKTLEDEDMNIESRHNAWMLVTVTDPRDKDHTMELMLSPGQYNEYNDSMGTNIPMVLAERGIMPQEEKEDEDTEEYEGIFAHIARVLVAPFSLWLSRMRQNKKLRRLQKQGVFSSGGGDVPAGHYARGYGNSRYNRGASERADGNRN